ncbi:MAG: ATP-binding protein [Flavobacteriales bacterium]
MRRILGHTIRSAVLPLIGLLAGPLPAVSQEVWSREQYMSESGLLQNRVHEIVRDEWGGLLIGTEGGLVRFDGDHFRQIGLMAHEGIQPTRVLDIIIVSDGEFVVQDAGCRQYIYRNDELVPVTANAPTRRYTSRFAGAMPSAALATRVMDPDSVLDGKKEWSSRVRTVSLGGERWCLRTDHDLLVYQGDVLVRRWPLPPGRSSHLFMSGGVLFVFDFHGQAYRVDPDQGTVISVGMCGFPPPETRGGQLAWRFSWDPEEQAGSIIANDMLYAIRTAAAGDSLDRGADPLELPTGVDFSSLVELDGGNALAMGTGTKGLFIYRRNTMRSLLCNVTQDGAYNVYNAQAPYGASGVLTSTHGSARLFTSTGCSAGPPPIRGFDEVAIIRDAAQHYWYGRADTLFLYDLARKEERPVRTSFRPLCFLEEGPVMWVGTAQGVHRFEGGASVLQYPLSGGDLSLRPNALCRTPDGELWMATCSGVYRASAAGAWSIVPGLAGICARTLAVVDGAVLIGSYGSGAFLHRSGRTLRLPRDEQGFLSHVHGFMPDSAGFLWMSTNQGLFRAKWSDVKAWERDTTQRIYYAGYSKRAGIQNSEFNGGCSPPYTRTADGWASFPTMDGAVWFRPEEVPDAYPGGKVLLEGVYVDEVPVHSGQVLAWDHKEVRVDLSIAYWGDPGNVRLEYALTGVTGERWVPLPVGQRQLRFSTLPAGGSVLRLRKLGSSVRGDGLALEFIFRVATPFYRTAWFILLCIVAAVLLFITVLRLNDARLRRKNFQLEKKVRERTSELMEANAVLRRSLEMKEMLVSIISHDIVTPLRFIARVANGAARLVPTASDGRVGGTLNDLARSSDKLHANAQDLLHWIKRQDGRIDLRPKNVALHAFVEEVLDMDRERAMEKAIRLVNEVPMDYTLRTDRNVLSIVLHNVVANAITHTEAGTITVTGRPGEEGYALMVRDTGVGMTGAALRHAQRVQRKGALGAMNEEGERDVQGLGLLIIADLLALLGGRFTIDSVPGEGTTVVLMLPGDITPMADGQATE